MCCPKIRFHYKNNPDHPITREYPILAVYDHALTSQVVNVCIEENITLHLDGQTLTSLKVSPDDFPAFAIGFVICEALVPGIESIREVLIDFPDISITTHDGIPYNKKHMTEIRSAGVGIRNREDYKVQPSGSGISISIDTLLKGIDAVHEASPVWKVTGGTHCSAILDEHGRLVSSSEDIGRHNSVDKTVGKALLHGADLTRCFIVCTGRLPADMVAKAHHAGITMMVSNNAPFSSGIEFAEDMNMTLIGFARPPKMSIYSHPERITF
jgi:formate dehydrogenase accessory protein FdhD